MYLGCTNNTIQYSTCTYLNTDSNTKLQTYTTTIYTIVLILPPVNPWPYQLITTHIFVRSHVIMYLCIYISIYL